MKLTAIKIKNSLIKDKDYKLADGNGLYLLVSKSGGKYWRYNYRFHGKQKTYSLGVYPDMSLIDTKGHFLFIIHFYSVIFFCIKFNLIKTLYEC